MGARFYPMDVKPTDPSLILGADNVQKQANFIGTTYFADGEVPRTEDPLLVVISHQLWRHCVLSNNGQPTFRQKFEIYTDTEGAAPTVVSLFRFYAEVDDFMNFLRASAAAERSRETVETTEHPETDQEHFSSEGGSQMDTGEESDQRYDSDLESAQETEPFDAVSISPALRMFSRSGPHFN